MLRFAADLRTRVGSAVLLGLTVLQTIAGPTLGVRLESEALEFSWPASEPDYVLENSPTFATGWAVTPQPATTNGTELTISIPAPASTTYFRLRQRVDFYGRPVGLIKLFGQRRWGDASPGRVTGGKIFHASGVVVDRSRTPNTLYAVDTGNSRILGFRSYASKTADLVFGQPDAFSGAANGDCNLGFRGSTTETNLCLSQFPDGTNQAEQWLRLGIDVDGEGNLYVPDFYNNRVVVYYAPFSDDPSGGKGDTVADLVIGQDDFRGTGINRGRGASLRDSRSLYLSFGGFDHVSSRGVTVDAGFNVWVADTFNYRVLRFPRGTNVADLVIGQANFTSASPACQSPGAPDAAPLNRLCTPTLARVNPETGELYVIDEFPGGFPARLLVYQPPFVNGMAAARVISVKQPLQGDYAGGYRLTHATGLAFNPFKTDDLIDPAQPDGPRYRDGVFWLQARDSRTLLLTAAGDILLAVGAPDIFSRGGEYEDFGHCGQDPLAPFNLIWPGGPMGFDSNNNLYLADEATHRVARLALPYRTHKVGANTCMPAANGGLFATPANEGGVTPNSVGPASFHQDRVGVCIFGDQLIVRDHQRYMVWSNYLARADGEPADLFIGQSSGNNIASRNHIMGRAMHAVDDRDRLWATGEHGRLMLYQLPFRKGALPLRELVPLYWADDGTEIDYRCEQPVAFDRLNRHLWVYDTSHHRLLRVRNPDDFRGKLLVDSVLGQKNKTDAALNRGMAKPDAASFGDVNDLKFDRLGNLFVVDNTYECHPNGRILAFLAADLAAIDSLFPPTVAKKLFVTETFDQTQICRIHDPVHGDRPFSPVCVAFNSRNEMVVGNDGYYRDPRKRPIRQLYLFRKPLTKATPDAVIELPLGAPAEITFDASNNLIVQDHTWNKVWIINYDVDPSWLQSYPLD